MKKLFVITGLAAILLSSCSQETTVIDTVKTDTGICFVVIHENIALGSDRDNEYPVPCEITTDYDISNVEE